MNYLAHAYFSFNNEEALIGNMISDFVKGRRKFDYSPGIQLGISLHRSIDRFTDEHAATAEAKKFFRPAVGLYAGAFIDIVYDHFLALEEKFWQTTSLQDFADQVYHSLFLNEEKLPERFRAMIPYMKSQNWLFNYRLMWGIERSFEGLVRRAVYLNNSVAALEVFKREYKALEQLSHTFLPDVKNFAEVEFDRLLRT